MKIKKKGDFNPFQSGGHLCVGLDGEAGISLLVFGDSNN